MNTSNLSVVSGSRSLSLDAGSSAKRICKKDFFLSLPESVKGRSAKEAAYAKYADSFSALEAAAFAGAMAAGLVRITGNKVAKSGKVGGVRYEVVKERTVKLSEKKRLELEIAQLRADNARLQEIANQADADYDATLVEENA